MISALVYFDTGNTGDLSLLPLLDFFFSICSLDGALFILPVTIVFTRIHSGAVRVEVDGGAASY